jgi:hypothetical protein
MALPHPIDFFFGTASYALSSWNWNFGSVCFFFGKTPARSRHGNKIWYSSAACRRVCGTRSAQGCSGPCHVWILIRMTKYKLIKNDNDIDRVSGRPRTRSPSAPPAPPHSLFPALALPPLFGLSPGQGHRARVHELAA